MKVRSAPEATVSPPEPEATRPPAAQSFQDRGRAVGAFGRRIFTSAPAFRSHFIETAATTEYGLVACALRDGRDSRVRGIVRALRV